MKKWILSGIILLNAITSSAQADEIQQLALNIEKLTQLKKILTNLYDGYKILNTGYTAIKDISEGNFNLHDVFLDGLLQVSPAVKKYKRIVDIIQYQTQIIKDSKRAYSLLKKYNGFTVYEVEYLGKVYDNLIGKSLKNIDELTLIITARQLRMNDAERLQAIDKIFERIQTEFAFLKDFNNSASMLALQRAKDQLDVDISRGLNGLR